MARKFSVLVYSGDGVSPTCLSQTIRCLKSLLSTHYTVVPLSTEALLNDPWHSKCALLVIPGGRDMPYHRDLAGHGNELIRAFVKGGGSYLGLCAGGYYACDEIKFMMDDPVHKIHDKRELAFWEGACEGTVFKGFKYKTEDGTIPATVEVDLDAVRAAVGVDSTNVPKGAKKTVSYVYTNGGGAFLPPSSPSPSFAASSSTLARYADVADAPSAVVFVRVGGGGGRVVLTGIHPEYSPLDEPLRAALQRLPGGGPSAEDLTRIDRDRLELMSTLLLALGVSVPDDEEERTELNRPTHPLPQLLVSHPSKPHLPSDLLDRISSHFKPQEEPSSSPSDQPSALVDANDTFHFHKSASFPSVASYLAQARSTTLSPAEADNLDGLVKHVIVADKDDATLETIEQEEWAPLFGFARYWAELDAARQAEANEHGASDASDDRTRLGDLLLYSEAVTSTQTMQDKNPKFLHSLPTPLVSTASFQLSGRGRSGNVWLSPAGCLQFTKTFDLPAAMAPKAVFVQYLVALAISEALDPNADLGVRIKWPNDIYALVKSEDGKVEKQKMGGILVNTNYANGSFKVMVGSGVNILNAHPTTSLALLTSIHNSSIPTSSPHLPAPTMEGSLARILAHLEPMWALFLASPGGGFDPFLTRYLDRWLHSDELVTLQTTTPPTPVRIETITLDHGLLRTRPVRNASADGGSEYERIARSLGKPKKGGEPEEFIDLQPDGNSFDIMAGLIRVKR